MSQVTNKIKIFGYFFYMDALILSFIIYSRNYYASRFIGKLGFDYVLAFIYIFHWYHFFWDFADIWLVSHLWLALPKVYVAQPPHRVISSITCANTHFTASLMHNATAYF